MQLYPQTCPLFTCTLLIYNNHNNYYTYQLNGLDYEPSDYFQGSYDASAEIEVDSTYNADNDEQLGELVHSMHLVFLSMPVAYNLWLSSILCLLKQGVFLAGNLTSIE